MAVSGDGGWVMTALNRPEVASRLLCVTPKPQPNPNRPVGRLDER